MVTLAPLAGARAALATMHAKERALALPLRAIAGIDLTVASGIDTDTFGTFTAEIGRRGSAAETARRKAEAAARASGLRYGIGSEGSFGPDPALVFLPSGEERLAFLDVETGRAIEVVSRTFRTNFAHWIDGDAAVLDAYLTRVGFPSHAVVVRPNKPRQGDVIVKGIVDGRRLEAALRDARASSADGLARVETDMRAHLNPTRMRAIRVAARRLARRLATACPACGAFGYGQTGTIAGLPCAGCGTPTIAARATRFSCEACGHEEHRPKDGAVVADPGLCSVCNP